MDTDPPYASDEMIAWWVKRLMEDLQFVDKATSTWNTIVLVLSNGQRFKVTVEQLPPSSKYKVDHDKTGPQPQNWDLPQSSRPAQPL